MTVSYVQGGKNASAETVQLSLSALRFSRWSWGKNGGNELSMKPVLNRHSWLNVRKCVHCGNLRRVHESMYNALWSYDVLFYDVLFREKNYLFPQPNCLTWEWSTISTSTWNSFPKVYIQIQSKRILRMPCQKSQTLWPAFRLSFPSRTLFVNTGFHCQEGGRPLGLARGLSVLRPFLHRNLIHQFNFLHN